jgi:hypothetical protein
MRSSSLLLTGYVLIFLAANAVVADAQSSQASVKTLNLQGTVVSATKASIVVKTDDGQYQVFLLDRETVRPQAIPQDAQVAVVFPPANESTTPTADSVIITALPQPKVAALTGEVPPPPTNEPVPASVRQLERNIQRQSRKYRLGVRGGMALDPELFVFGVQSQMGPFFSENLWARPNLDIGFGELTTLVALNFEAAYRLPVLQRGSRWNVYAGGGPGLNFSHRNLVEETDRGKIDFGDLDFDLGFNILLGVSNRDGLFMELKSSAYSLPTIRLAVGYNF